MVVQARKQKEMKLYLLVQILWKRLGRFMMPAWSSG
jgi:hypothetical protein